MDFKCNYIFHNDRIDSNWTGICSRLSTLIFYTYYTYILKCHVFITNEISFLYRFFSIIFRNDTCTTPPYPNNGSYLINGATKPEGTEVPNYSVLTYKCNPGYTTSRDEPNSICILKKWIPEIKCIREYHFAVKYHTWSILHISSYGHSYYNNFPQIFIKLYYVYYTRIERFNRYV